MLLFLGVFVVLGGAVTLGIVLTPTTRATPSGHTASRSGSSGASLATTAGKAISMRGATAEVCRGPQPAGPGRPDTTLSEIFHVTDSGHAPYLLGWQVVPYVGPGTYHFGVKGTLLALEPPASGAPLGFATGTVTVAKSGTSGTINASVKLTAGGMASVTGPWSCAGKS